MLKLSTSAWLGFVLTALLSSTPAEACKCLASYPVCTEVAQTDVIFIGTVESIEPAFLDPWNADRLSLLPTEEILRLRQEGSPASLAKLKQIYLKLYPNMPVHYKEEIVAAQTHTELRKAFDAISAQGKQTRLRVKTVFRHKDDDDDDDLTGKVVTVWTDSSDCGYNFQPGETYLVYADNDEETGQLATSICHRTSRLSDAGADLAYLYYFRNGGANSTRLEGFVTSDADAAPLLDVVIKLNSGQTPRYTRSDADGKFIFDGLAGGDYEISAYDSRYPQTVRQLGYPKSFHAEPNSCARQILTVPKD
jgi:hypothetical protein